MQTHSMALKPDKLLVYLSRNQSSLPNARRRFRSTVLEHMSSFVNVIQTFRNGALSSSEFFAQIDGILATNSSNSARLLEILTEEHTKYPLPPNVYAEAHRRIEHSGESTQRIAADETQFQESPTERPSFDPPLSSFNASGELLADGSELAKGVGDTLNGRFVLEECLGVGGMGTVFKALDLRKLEASDRKPHIAIKILNVQFRGHPKSLIALQREAKKAQALAHANIVTVYDFDRDGSLVYLTMEYLSGKPLSQIFKTPSYAGMSLAQALPIIKGMGNALAYAHERGLVHCDFKPANVFLTDSGQVKVIDFGIARAFEKPGEQSDATIFDAGSLGGMTPAYASPEMLERLEPDPRDDVYALACITYELLTGRHPFDRMSATQARAAGRRPQRPNSVGLGQWRALRAALSFDRKTRTPTVAQFLQGMSGERRRAVFVALVATSAVVGAISIAASLLSFYWQSRNTDGTKVKDATVSSQPTAAPVATTIAPSKTSAQPSMPELSLASVMPIVAGVPCSALAPVVHDSTLQVHGFLSASFGLTRLKETLGKVVGVKTVSADVQQVNDDKCGVLNQLAPYWTANRLGEEGAFIRTKGDALDLIEDDPLILDVKTPAYDSYVRVDYYLADGNVFHMLPALDGKDHKLPANSVTTIGRDGEWVISQPLGTELIVLVATPAPLFDDSRPQFESARDYEQAMGRQLRRLAERYGAQKIAVAIVQISTRPRKS
jgi:serine/threonine protein kinase